MFLLDTQLQIWWYKFLRWSIGHTVNAGMTIGLNTNSNKLSIWQYLKGVTSEKVCFCEDSSMPNQIWSTATTGKKSCNPDRKTHPNDSEPWKPSTVRTSTSWQSSWAKMLALRILLWKSTTWIFHKSTILTASIPSPSVGPRHEVWVREG